MVESEQPDPELIKKAGHVITKAIDQDKPIPIQTLVKNGLPIDTVIQTHKMNALHLASSVGTVEIMQTVLELNANPNAKDSIGRTPLHFACKRGSLDHFNILIQIEEIDLDA